MSGAREAIDATMLAAAIGIDRPVEADIGGFVPGDRSPGRIDGHRGRDRRQIVVFDRSTLPAVILARPVARLEAAGAI